LTKNQAGFVKGYKWLNPFNFLVRLIKVSDIASQIDILSIQPDFAAEIAKMSLPNGYTIVKCDPRVLSPDGILLPDGISLEDFMNRGSSCFPTAFTRELAIKWGREWSRGHAHLGVIALAGEPLMKQSGQKVEPKKAMNNRDSEFIPFLPTNADGEPDLTCVTLSNSQVEHLVTLLQENLHWKMTNPKDLVARFSSSEGTASVVVAAVVEPAANPDADADTHSSLSSTPSSVFSEPIARLVPDDFQPLPPLPPGPVAQKSPALSFAPAPSFPPTCSFVTPAPQPDLTDAEDDPDRPPTDEELGLPLCWKTYEQHFHWLQYPNLEDNETVSEAWRGCPTHGYL